MPVNSLSDIRIPHGVW